MTGHCGKVILQQPEGSPQTLACYCQLLFTDSKLTRRILGSWAGDGESRAEGGGWVQPTWVISSAVLHSDPSDPTSLQCWPCWPCISWPVLQTLHEIFFRPGKFDSEKRTPNWTLVTFDTLWRPKLMDKDWPIEQRLGEPAASQRTTAALESMYWTFELPWQLPSVSDLFLIRYVTGVGWLDWHSHRVWPTLRFRTVTLEASAPVLEHKGWRTDGIRRTKVEFGSAKQ